MFFRALKSRLRPTAITALWPRRLPLVAVALGSLVLLNSCGAWPKFNAPQTEVTARSAPVAGFSRDLPRHQGTDFLSFDELKDLTRDPTPGGPLESRLTEFFNRPIVSNEAFHRGHLPTRAHNEHLGDFLRVATWNLMQSRHADKAASVMRSEAAFEALLDPETFPPGSMERAELLRERQRLAASDIILLQEIDIGIGRSGYRDIAREMARTLGMNYAYAPKQLEIDPVMLGLDPISEGHFSPDPERYKGVFGLAVLSRYPIKSARCFQLQSQPYDWHAGEKAGIDPLEATRRFATEIVFENKIIREMKVGGRIYFRVDLEVPGLPGDTLTVINTHLEIKARPQDREAQLAEILGHIADIPHTVVMAGDFNTSLVDLSPTSTLRVLARATMDSETWFSVVTNLVMSVPAVFNSARLFINQFKNLHSPMAFHIPLVLPNENRQIFHLIENFRFNDGGKFDFRGNRQRSINRSTATLANSNEKAVKGRRTTFSVQRPIGPFGRDRLDWIFVKPPPGDDDSYRLAPHFGETLSGIVEAIQPPLSDHSPSVVDLPLHEPPGIPPR